MLLTETDSVERGKRRQRKQVITEERRKLGRRGEKKQSNGNGRVKKRGKKERIGKKEA